MAEDNTSAACSPNHHPAGTPCRLERRGEILVTCDELGCHPATGYEIYLASALAAAEAERDRLRERMTDPYIARIATDAARYRWLRDQPATIHFDREIAFTPPGSLTRVYVKMIGHTELDAASDAALSPPKGDAK